jgi:arylsulfatase A-like enzyme
LAAATTVVVFAGALQIAWNEAVSPWTPTLSYALAQSSVGVAFVDMLDSAQAHRFLPVFSAPVDSVQSAGWLVLCSIPLVCVTVLTTLISERILALGARGARIIVLAAWPATLGAFAAPTSSASTFAAVCTLVLAGLVITAIEIRHSWFIPILSLVSVALLSLVAYSTVHALSVAPTPPVTSPPTTGMPAANAWVRGKAVLGTTITLDPVPDVPEAKQIILITLDTTRADHLALYGYDRNTTPHLAAMASKEGIAFERAYASSPWTRPSTASLMTSLSPKSHGVESPRHAIGSGVPTLAAALRADGFRTAALVANVYAGLSLNLHSGFEEFWQTPGFVVGSIKVLALDWISLHASQPFFLYLHLIDPHADYKPPGGFEEEFTDPEYDGPFTGHFEEMLSFRSKERQLPQADLGYVVGLYDGEIAYADHQLGLFFDAIRERGLWDDMLVIVLADHGEEFEDHGGVGHCRTLYEELVRMPLLVKLPGGRPTGFLARVAEHARIIDVAPTILQLAGSPMPSAFQGESLIDGMRGLPADRDVYVRTRGCDGRHPLKEAVVHDHFKLIQSAGGSTELYDLVDDPKETRDLTGDEPELVERMRSRLNELASEAKTSRPNVKAPSATETAQLRALGYLPAPP